MAGHKRRSQGWGALGRRSNCSSRSRSLASVGPAIVLDAPSALVAAVVLDAGMAFDLG